MNYTFKKMFGWLTNFYWLRELCGFCEASVIRVFRSSLTRPKVKAMCTHCLEVQRGPFVLNGAFVFGLVTRKDFYSYSKYNNNIKKEYQGHRMVTVEDFLSAQPDLHCTEVIALACACKCHRNSPGVFHCFCDCSWRPQIKCCMVHLRPDGKSSLQNSNSVPLVALLQIGYSWTLLRNDKGGILAETKSLRIHLKAIEGHLLYSRDFPGSMGYYGVFTIIVYLMLLTIKSCTVNMELSHKIGINIIEIKQKSLLSLYKEDLRYIKLLFIYILYYAISQRGILNLMVLQISKPTTKLDGELGYSLCNFADFIDRNNYFNNSHETLSSDKLP
ncbi:putative signal peptide protein [Puccinia sorghi]|uniref:Putative signal peptide protein n=1 Tax=Puccinia sorghi TaxID=27349 RepID=A0A0L6UU32_9BASI|nr:putative signal peptide protein [Puccinia sorghi]